MTNGADYPGPEPWPLAGLLMLVLAVLAVLAVLFLF